MSELSEIKNQLDKIQNNELVHLKSAIAVIKDNQQQCNLDIISIKTDLGWVKKLQWFLITTLVGTCLTSLASLVVSIAIYLIDK